MKAPKKKQNNSAALDKLTFLTGILLPFLTIPQAYMVVVEKETVGVSVWTWSFYLFASLLFAIYGVVHREKLLMFTYFPFTLIEGAIVFGLILQ